MASYMEAKNQQVKTGQNLPSYLPEAPGMVLLIEEVLQIFLESTFVPGFRSMIKGILAAPPKATPPVIRG